MTHKLSNSSKKDPILKMITIRFSRSGPFAAIGLLILAAICVEGAAAGFFDTSFFGRAFASATDDSVKTKKTKKDTTAQRTEITQWSQGFETDAVWGDPASDPTRVASGTNGIASKTGGFHAEANAGDFTRWGGYNAIFPPLGFTTSVDIYFNTAGGYANDTRFDYTSAINNPAGTHRRDFIFNCGFYSDAGPNGSGDRFVCSASNNAPGWPRDPGRDPFVVTNASGWFTLKHHFYSNGGVLAVDLSIFNGSGALLKTWTLSDPSDIIGTTVGGNRYGWFAVMAFPYLAIDNSMRANVVAANVEKVTSADLTATPNLTDWFFYNDENDTIDNALGSFVNGPATAPMGAGSAQISVTGTQRRNLATYQFAGTPLASINELKYSTFNPSAGNPGSPSRSGYLQFNVDFDGSDIWQRRILFLPSDNGAVTQDTWQEWDTIKNGTALWRHSGPTWPIGIGGGGEPGTTPKTWTQILTQYPGVRIRVSDPWLGIRVGEPYADGYTENIDKFVFGTTASTTIFDFEPLPIMVDDDGFASSTDCDAADPANTTIQAGVNAATAGATVKVCPGTYNEDVSISGAGKANLTLLGSGVDVSTIIGQHTSGGPDTVQILSAPGVTIDGFTITRTGNNAVDWAANAQNQGINVGASANVTIRNNKITGNRNGIYVGQSSHFVTIYRNNIDFNRTGVHLVDNNNATIEENFITNNWTMGILYREELPVGPDPTGITIRNNNISGNWYSDIEFREPPGISLINASGNYLGTTNPTRVTTTSLEPGYAGQIPVLYGGAAVPPANQTGTIAGPESARVDYSPFLNSGTDTQPGTPGFQGDPTHVTVNSDSAQANVGQNNIQEAINIAPAGGSVTALAGTYTGNVTVNQPISLLGSPTITGALSVTSAGASVAPGLSPGIINSGDLSFTPGSNVSMELNGTTPGTGHDQFNVTGTVNLNGATLNISTGFAIPNGTQFVIVNNDAADAVTGTFAGLAESATFNVSGTTFTISYVGGTGNDVVLTASAVTCNNVSIPTNIETLTAQQVLVPLNIDDTTGRGILSVTYTLTYNSAVLQYIGIDQIGTLSSAFNFTVNSTTPGTLIINLYGDTPLAGAGVLMNLRFQAIGAIGTTSAMNFGGMLINEGVPCVNTTNGLVTIISSTISGVVSYGNALVPTPGFRPVPHTTLSAAGSVPQSTTSAVVTGAYTLSGLGAGAYTVTPSKTGDVNGITGLDAALISQHVVNLITLNANQLAAADVSNNGTVSGLDAAYISQWVVNLPNPGITGTWRFIPTSRNYANVNTAQTNQDYVGILMGEVTGNWVAPLLRPEAIIREVDAKKAIRVEAPVLRADPGTEVEIPLSIRDISGKGVAAYQFDIEYDPDVLEPRKAAATLAGTISEGMMVTSNSPEPGLLKIVVYGVHPIEGGGPLVNLKFTAIGAVGSRSALTIKGFMLNEGEIDVLVKDGEVAIEESEGASISGRLLLPTGAPAGKLRVTVRDSRGEMRAVLADDNGQFTFGGLTVGETYVVAVDAKRSGFAPQTVSLVEKKVRIDLIARQ
ncbi:MAG: cohesin domain-containing protein [Pyrinomonadaceae bacterium]